MMTSFCDFVSIVNKNASGDSKSLICDEGLCST